jgi:hypothetical protein
MGSDLGSGWSPKPVSRWGTGPENQGDLRVRGSIPPLSSDVETRCLSVRHTGPLRRERSRSESSTLSVSSRVGSPGRAVVNPCLGLLAHLSSGLIAALDSNRLAPKVFQAARRLASSEERVRLPLGALDARVADRRVRFPPRAQWFFCRAGAGTQAGLISRPTSVRFRPLQPRTRSPLLMVGRSSRRLRPDKLGGDRSTRGASLGHQGKNSALADRGSHVCKSTVVWWEDRRAPPLKRRWRRTRPVPGRGPFESVERLRYQGGEAATQAPVKRPTAGSNPAPGADRASETIVPIG